MDYFEKFFRKINADERAVLSDLIKKLRSRETNGLQIKKLSNSNFYRLRKSIFRIIFHYEHSVLVIDAIRLRNEKTYREY